MAQNNPQSGWGRSVIAEITITADAFVRALLNRVRFLVVLETVGTVYQLRQPDASSYALHDIFLAGLAVSLVGLSSWHPTLSIVLLLYS
jgi:hypothetical protein